MRRIMLLVVGLAGSVLVSMVLLGMAGRGLPHAVKFPCTVEQMPLEVLELRSYTGPFLEDGTRRQVKKVAALVLYNPSGTLLEQGAVKLNRGDGVLVFSFTRIPPGARILVLESMGKPYSEEPVTGCWGWCVAGQEDPRLRVEEGGRTSLAVTNVSEQTVQEAVVYYKDYDPGQRMYMGGITHTLQTGKLLPGHRVILPAFQYLSGNSMVVP